MRYGMDIHDPHRRVGDYWHRQGKWIFGQKFNLLRVLGYEYKIWPPLFPFIISNLNLSILIPNIHINFFVPFLFSVLCFPLVKKIK